MEVLGKTGSGTRSGLLTVDGMAVRVLILLLAYAADAVEDFMSDLSLSRA